jgi:chromosome segregation ATPase
MGDPMTGGEDLSLLEEKQAVSTRKSFEVPLASINADSVQQIIRTKITDIGQRNIVLGFLKGVLPKDDENLQYLTFRRYLVARTYINIIDNANYRSLVDTPIKRFTQLVVGKAHEMFSAGGINKTGLADYAKGLLNSDMIEQNVQSPMHVAIGQVRDLLGILVHFWVLVMLSVEDAEKGNRNSQHYYNRILDRFDPFDFYNLVSDFLVHLMRESFSELLEGQENDNHRDELMSIFLNDVVGETLSGDLMYNHVVFEIAVPTFVSNIKNSEEMANPQGSPNATDELISQFVNNYVGARNSGVDIRQAAYKGVDSIFVTGEAHLWANDTGYRAQRAKIDAAIRRVELEVETGSIFHVDANVSGKASFVRNLFYRNERAVAPLTIALGGLAMRSMHEVLNDEMRIYAMNENREQEIHNQSIQFNVGLKDSGLNKRFFAWIKSFSPKLTLSQFIHPRILVKLTDGNGNQGIAHAISYKTVFQGQDKSFKGFTCDLLNAQTLGVGTAVTPIDSRHEAPATEDAVGLALNIAYKQSQYIKQKSISFNMDANDDGYNYYMNDPEMYFFRADQDTLFDTFHGIAACEIFKRTFGGALFLNANVFDITDAMTNAISSVRWAWINTFRFGTRVNSVREFGQTVDTSAIDVRMFFESLNGTIAIGQIQTPNGLVTSYDGARWFTSLDSTMINIIAIHAMFDGQPLDQAERNNGGFPSIYSGANDGQHENNAIKAYIDMFMKHVDLNVTNVNELVNQDTKNVVSGTDLLTDSLVTIMRLMTTRGLINKTVHTHAPTLPLSFSQTNRVTTKVYASRGKVMVNDPRVVVIRILSSFGVNVQHELFEAEIHQAIGTIGPFFYMKELNAVLVEGLLDLREKGHILLVPFTKRHVVTRFLNLIIKHVGDTRDAIEMYYNTTVQGLMEPGSTMEYVEALRKTRREGIDVVKETIGVNTQTGKMVTQIGNEATTTEIMSSLEFYQDMAITSNPFETTPWWFVFNESECVAKFNAGNINRAWLRQFSPFAHRFSTFLRFLDGLEFIGMAVNKAAGLTFAVSVTHSVFDSETLFATLGENALEAFMDTVLTYYMKSVESVTRVIIKSVCRVFALINAQYRNVSLGSNEDGTKAVIEQETGTVDDETTEQLINVNADFPDIERASKLVEYLSLFIGCNIHTFFDVLVNRQGEDTKTELVDIICFDGEYGSDSNSRPMNQAEISLVNLIYTLLSSDGGRLGGNESSLRIGGNNINVHLQHLANVSPVCHLYQRVSNYTEEMIFGSIVTPPAVVPMTHTNLDSSNDPKGVNDLNTQQRAQKFVMQFPSGSGLVTVILKGMLIATHSSYAVGTDIASLVGSRVINPILTSELYNTPNKVGIEREVGKRAKSGEGGFNGINAAVSTTKALYAVRWLTERGLSESPTQSKYSTELDEILKKPPFNNILRKHEVTLTHAFDHKEIDNALVNIAMIGSTYKRAIVSDVAAAGAIKSAVKELLAETCTLMDRLTDDCINARGMDVLLNVDPNELCDVWSSVAKVVVKRRVLAFLKGALPESFELFLNFNDGRSILNDFLRFENEPAFSLDAIGPEDDDEDNTFSSFVNFDKELSGGTSSVNPDGQMDEDEEEEGSPDRFKDVLGITDKEAKDAITRKRMDTDTVSMFANYHSMDSVINNVALSGGKLFTETNVTTNTDGMPKGTNGWVYNVVSGAKFIGNDIPAMETLFNGSGLDGSVSDRFQQMVNSMATGSGDGIEPFDLKGNDIDGVARALKMNDSDKMNDIYTSFFLSAFGTPNKEGYMMGGGDLVSGFVPVSDLGSVARNAHVVAVSQRDIKSGDKRNPGSGGQNASEQLNEYKAKMRANKSLAINFSESLENTRSSLRADSSRSRTIGGAHGANVEKMKRFIDSRRNDNSRGTNIHTIGHDSDVAMKTRLSGTVTIFQNLDSIAKETEEGMDSTRLVLRLRPLDVPKESVTSNQVNMSDEDRAILRTVLSRMPATSAIQKSIRSHISKSQTASEPIPDNKRLSSRDSDKELAEKARSFLGLNDADVVALVNTIRKLRDEFKKELVPVNGMKGVVDKNRTELKRMAEEGIENSIARLTGEISEAVDDFITADEELFGMKVTKWSELKGAMMKRNAKLALVHSKIGVLASIGISQNQELLKKIKSHRSLNTERFKTMQRAAGSLASFVSSQQDTLKELVQQKESGDVTSENIGSEVSSFIVAIVGLQETLDRALTDENEQESVEEQIAKMDVVNDLLANFESLMGSIQHVFALRTQDKKTILGIADKYIDKDTMHRLEMDDVSQPGISEYGSGEDGATTSVDNLLEVLRTGLSQAAEKAILITNDGMTKLIEEVEIVAREREKLAAEAETVKGLIKSLNEDVELAGHDNVDVSIENVIDDAKSKLRHNLDRISQLEQEISEKDTENSELSQKITQLEDSIRTLNETIATNTSAHEEGLGQIIDAVVSLHDKIRESIKSRASLNGSNKKVTVEAIKTVIDQMSTDLDEMQELITKKETTIDAMVRDTIDAASAMVGNLSGGDDQATTTEDIRAVFSKLRSALVAAGKQVMSSDQVNAAIHGVGTSLLSSEDKETQMKKLVNLLAIAPKLLSRDAGETKRAVETLSKLNNTVDEETLDNELQDKGIWKRSELRFQSNQWKLGTSGVDLVKVANRVSELTQELVNTRSQASAIITDKKSVITDLGNQLKVAGKEKLALESQKEKLETEKTNLASRIGELETQLKDEQSKVSDFETQVQGKDDKITNLEGELQTLRETETRLTKEAEGLRSDLEKVNDDLDNASEKLNDVEQQVTDLKREKNELERDLAAKNKEVNDINTRYDDLETRNDEITSSLESARNEVERLKAAAADGREGAQGTLEQVRGELEELKRMDKETKAQLKDVQQQKKEKERELKGLQETNRKTNNELKAAESKAANLQTQLDNLTKKRTEDQEKIRKINEEKKKVDSELKEARRNIKQLESAVTAKDRDLEKIRTEKSTLDSKIAELQNELSEKGTQISTLTSELESARSDASSNQSQLEEIQSQIDEKEMESSSLRKELEQSRNESQRLQDKTSELQSEIETLKDTVQREEGEKSLLNEEIKTLRAELSDMEKRQSSRVDAGVDNGKIDREEAERLKRKIASLVSSINTQIARLSGGGKEIQIPSITGDDGGVLTAFKEIVEKLIKLKRSSDNEKKQLETRITQKESEIQRANEKLTATENKMSEIVKAIADLEKKRNGLNFKSGRNPDLVDSVEGVTAGRGQKIVHTSDRFNEVLGRMERNKALRSVKRVNALKVGTNPDTAAIDDLIQKDEAILNMLKPIIDNGNKNFIAVDASDTNLTGVVQKERPQPTEDGGTFSSQEKAAMDEQIKRLEDERDSLQSQQQNDQLELSKLQEAFQKQGQELESSKNDKKTIADLEKKLSELRTHQDAATGDPGALAQLQGELNESKRRSADLEGYLTTLSVVISDNESETTPSGISLDRHGIDALKQQVRSTKTKLRSNSEAIRKIESALSMSTSSDPNYVVAAVLKMSEESKRIVQDIVNLVKASDREGLVAGQDLKAGIENVKVLKGIIERLERNSPRDQTLSTQMDETVRTLRENLANAQSERETAQEQLRHLMASQGSESEQISRLQNHIREKDAKIGELENRIDILEKTNTSLRQNSDDAKNMIKSQLEVAKSQLSQSRKELEEQASELDRSTRMLHEAQRESGKRQLEVQRLKAQLKSATDSLSETRELLSGAVSDTRRESEEEQARLKNTISDLRSQIAKLNQKLSDAVKEAGLAKSEKDLVLAQIKESHGDNHTLETLEARLKETKENVRKLQQFHSNVADALSSLGVYDASVFGEDKTPSRDAIVKAISSAVATQRTASTHNNHTTNRALGINAPSQSQWGIFVSDYGTEYRNIVDTVKMANAGATNLATRGVTPFVDEATRGNWMNIVNASNKIDEILHMASAFKDGKQFSNSGGVILSATGNNPVSIIHTTKTISDLKTKVVTNLAMTRPTDLSMSVFKDLFDLFKITPFPTHKVQQGGGEEEASVVIEDEDDVAVDGSSENIVMSRPFEDTQGMFDPQQQQQQGQTLGLAGTQTTRTMTSQGTMTTPSQSGIGDVVSFPGRAIESESQGGLMHAQVVSTPSLVTTAVSSTREIATQTGDSAGTVLPSAPIDMVVAVSSNDNVINSATTYNKFWTGVQNNKDPPSSTFRIMDRWITLTTKMSSGKAFGVFDVYGDMEVDQRWFLDPIFRTQRPNSFPTWVIRRMAVVRPRSSKFVTRMRTEFATNPERFKRLFLSMLPYGTQRESARQKVNTWVASKDFNSVRRAIVNNYDEIYKLTKTQTEKFRKNAKRQTVPDITRSMMRTYTKEIISHEIISFWFAVMTTTRDDLLEKRVMDTAGWVKGAWTEANRFNVAVAYDESSGILVLLPGSIKDENTKSTCPPYKFPTFYPISGFPGTIKRITGVSTYLTSLDAQMDNELGSKFRAVNTMFNTARMPFNFVTPMSWSETMVMFNENLKPPQALSHQLERLFMFHSDKRALRTLKSGTYSAFPVTTRESRNNPMDMHQVSRHISVRKVDPSEQALPFFFAPIRDRSFWLDDPGGVIEYIKKYFFMTYDETHAMEGYPVNVMFSKVIDHSQPTDATREDRTKVIKKVHEVIMSGGVNAAGISESFKKFAERLLGLFVELNKGFGGGSGGPKSLEDCQNEHLIPWIILFSPRAGYTPLPAVWGLVVTMGLIQKGFVQDEFIDAKADHVMQAREWTHKDVTDIKNLSAFSFKSCYYGAQLLQEGQLIRNKQTGGVYASCQLPNKRQRV